MLRSIVMLSDGKASICRGYFSGFKPIPDEEGTETVEHSRPVLSRGALQTDPR